MSDSEHLIAVNWINKHLSSDFILTLFGLHWKGCPLLREVLKGDTINFSDMETCICCYDLIRLLREKKFKLEPPTLEPPSMQVRVYLNPINSNLYFLRRLAHNMERSEEIFLDKHNLCKDGTFEISTKNLNVNLYQLMSTMKEFFPRGKQTGKCRFYVGDDVLKRCALRITTWLALQVDKALDSIEKNVHT